MDPLQRLLAERACERLVVDFVHRLDLGEPGSVAELFTEDGTWEWPAGGRLVKGRAALREYFGSRPADRLSRRLMSNILVTPAAPDTALATSYFSTYRVDGYEGASSPPDRPSRSGTTRTRSARSTGCGCWRPGCCSSPSADRHPT